MRPVQERLQATADQPSGVSPVGAPWPSKSQRVHPDGFGGVGRERGGQTAHSWPSACRICSSTHFSPPASTASSKHSPTAGLKCWADKAYQSAGGPIRVPFRSYRLKRWQRRHNSTHAKIRCLGEQAMATLKGWRLLRKLRCSTNRITAIVQAILVLNHASA